MFDRRRLLNVAAVFIVVGRLCLDQESIPLACCLLTLAVKNPSHCSRAQYSSPSIGSAPWGNLSSLQTCYPLTSAPSSKDSVLKLSRNAKKKVSFSRAGKLPQGKFAL